MALYTPTSSFSHPIIAKIDSQTFFAVLWSGIAISLCFLAFRIFIRVKSFRRIYADDVLVLTAWVMFFASAIIWQTQRTAMYEIFTLTSGTVIPTSDQLAAARTAFRAEFAILFIYFTSLWTVKLSFLVLFQRLGQSVGRQKIWWWCVTGFTVATGATCIGTMDFNCFLRSLEYIWAECGSPSAIGFQWATLDYVCAVDVITDIAIITIPILMLWNVGIPWKKKLALMVIFSLTIIVIIVSIVRAALVNVKNSSPDISWLYLWSNIELAVSIIVSCLASFRQLFVISKKPGVVPISNKVPLWRSVLLSAFKSSKTTCLSSGNEDSFTQKIPRHETVSRPDSTEHIVPLDTVYISHHTASH